MAFRRALSLFLPLAFLSACVSVPEAVAPELGAMPVFSTEQDLERFIKRMGIAQREAQRHVPPPDDDAIIVVTGAHIEPPNITNVQEAGVDEGGIVKNLGDHFVVLRRGRLFTIRHGDDDLKPVDVIDAFPPGDDDPGDTWYDEMLVSGDTIMLIGYSYGEDGSEMSRFRMSGDGRLSYLDTHYLQSEDYYSSRNYASRLIDGLLVLYAPVQMNDADWREGLPTVSRRLPDGSRAPPQQLGSASEMAVPLPYLQKPFRGLDMLHTVTTCDVEDPAFNCSSRMVLGSWSRNFYVSRDAVYVWAGTGRYAFAADGSLAQAMLYRIPVDGAEPITGVGVDGSPVDQFSFLEDLDHDLMHVVVFDHGFGDAMWGSEYRWGEAALLQLPLDRFGDGSETAPQQAYRPLPDPDCHGIENRFVGRFLLLGANCGYEDMPVLLAAPLDYGWIQRLPLEHRVSRLDRLVEDGVAIGIAEGDHDSGHRPRLGFTSIRLDEESAVAQIVSTHWVEDTDESENRSQAFYYRPDDATPDGESGTMALPVTRYVEDDELADRWGHDHYLYFIRRDVRAFTELGELRSNYGHAPDDACTASCTDWYGNARPIFLGNRMFALMGYELIEGRIGDTGFEELRRVDFTPAVQTARVED